MSAPKVCPYCGHQLGPDDTLTMKWYAPRNWYVSNHSRPDNPCYCGIAGYKLEGDHFVRRSSVGTSGLPAELFEVTGPE